MAKEIIRFHFYSLKFTPYSRLAEENNSTSILKDTITYLMQELRGGKGFLIDKNRNREKEAPRELFMTSAVFMHKERRIRCSLALLRTE